MHSSSFVLSIAVLVVSATSVLSSNPYITSHVMREQGLFNPSTSKPSHPSGLTCPVSDYDDSLRSFLGMLMFARNMKEFERICEKGMEYASYGEYRTISSICRATEFKQRILPKIFQANNLPGNVCGEKFSDYRITSLGLTNSQGRAASTLSPPIRHCMTKLKEYAAASTPQETRQTTDPLFSTIDKRLARIQATGDKMTQCKSARFKHGLKNLAKLVASPLVVASGAAIALINVALVLTIVVGTLGLISPVDESESGGPLMEFSEYVVLAGIDMATAFNEKSPYFQEYKAAVDGSY